MATVVLTTPLEQLTRVGKSSAARLCRIGLRTVADLLRHYPFRYDDFGTVLPIAKLSSGTVATVRGRIELIASRRSPRRRMMLTEAVVADDTGVIQAVWFNQPYLARQFKPGEEIYLAGQVSYEFHQLQFVNPSVERVQPRQLHTARLVPIYPTTEGLTQRQLRFLVQQALPAAAGAGDPLPPDLRQRLSLPAWGWAIAQIHFPDHHRTLLRALHRLKFEELFGLQLALQSVLQKTKEIPAHPVLFNKESTRRFVGQLGFPLTVDQRKAAWKILQDISGSTPMNRLLEGEVGSGKTVVVAIAALNVARSGLQTVVMAPTEILAEQHFQTFRRLFAGWPVKLGLLTRTRREVCRGGQKTAAAQAVTKRQITTQAKSGALDILVGTHALLEDSVTFQRLALAVVDEQHRFGVQQRQRLLASDRAVAPHFLSLSATPIPRSLALALYGNLAISALRQLPQERKPILTKLVVPVARPKLYQFIRQQVGNGRQVFVVCPLIDPADISGIRSVQAEHAKLQREVFPDLRIGMLHGKLSAQLKRETMAAFVGQRTHILVATTVVEVGVDVPNASTIVIEGAERFGLSQLHQLRGRVGRASHQSYCFLCTTASGATADERLAAFLGAKDGFEIAELDLKLRGPGRMLGTEQSGVYALRLASLSDLDLAQQARDEAKKILEADPALERQPLLEALASRFRDREVHPE